MRHVTLVVFGREEDRRLHLQSLVGTAEVRFTDCTITFPDGSLHIARVVQDREDYRYLMGLELSDVVEHPGFVPPTAEWRSFIACRVRLPRGEQA